MIYRKCEVKIKKASEEEDDKRVCNYGCNMFSQINF